jgi:hypothetical protein
MEVRKLEREEILINEITADKGQKYRQGSLSPNNFKNKCSPVKIAQNPNDIDALIKSLNIVQKHD